MIYNSGGDVGYRSFMAFIPEDSIAVVTLSNCEHFPGREIAFTALNILKGKNEYVSKKPLYLYLGKILHSKGITAVKEEYKKLRNSENKEYQLNDVGLNNFARELINQNRLEEAKEIIQFNIEVHPESAFCYESLAGFYKMQKNYKEAIIYYRKALKYRPNNKRIIDTINDLEKLIES
jgi:tetratricopeptide (TPR) repeat protein